MKVTLFLILLVGLLTCFNSVWALSRVVRVLTGLPPSFVVTTLVGSVPRPSHQKGDHGLSHLSRVRSCLLCDDACTIFPFRDWVT